MIFIKHTPLILRLLLGLVGGFILAAQFSVLLPYYLPNLLNSTIAGFLLAIMLYPLLILWAFASRHIYKLAFIFTSLILLAWLAIWFKGDA